MREFFKSPDRASRDKANALAPLATDGVDQDVTFLEKSRVVIPVFGAMVRGHVRTV